MRILLVEDDDDTREAITDVVGEMGHEVVAVATGRDAMEPRSPPPELAIVDVILPDIDGRDVARVLRTTYPGIVVVGVTGWVRAAEEGGYDALNGGVLLKPFHLDDLEKVVEQTKGEALGRTATDGGADDGQKKKKDPR